MLEGYQHLIIVVFKGSIKLFSFDYNFEYMTLRLETASYKIKTAEIYFIENGFLK